MHQWFSKSSQHRCKSDGSALISKHVILHKKFFNNFRKHFLHDFYHGFLTRILQTLFLQMTNCVVLDYHTTFTWLPHDYRNTKKIYKYLFIKKILHSSTKGCVQMAYGRSSLIWLLDNFYVCFESQKNCKWKFFILCSVFIV